MSDQAHQPHRAAGGPAHRSGHADDRGRLACARACADRAPFFPEAGMCWSEAMIAQTRRQTSGLLRGVEDGLRHRLRELLSPAAIDALPAAPSWAAVSIQPEILSGALFSHLRARAALSVMSAINWPEDMPPDALSAPQFTFDHAQLRGALARWSRPAGDGAALPLDLPAEHAAELLWLVAALLAGKLADADAASSAHSLGALDRAAQEFLASHDEGAGPVARAALLAHRLSQHDAEPLAYQLAERGEHLLVCALIADRTGLETARVAEAIVHDDQPAMLHALCRAAGLGSRSCAALLLALGAVRERPRDERMVALVGDYDALSPEEARRRIVRLGLSHGFADALARAGVAD